MDIIDYRLPMLSIKLQTLLDGIILPRSSLIYIVALANILGSNADVVSLLPITGWNVI